MHLRAQRPPAARRRRFRQRAAPCACGSAWERLSRPATDLATLFPILPRGLSVTAARCGPGVAVRRVAPRRRVLRSTSMATTNVDAAIIAIAPHQLAAAIGDLAGAEEAWKEPLASGALSPGSRSPRSILPIPSREAAVADLALDDAPDSGCPTARLPCQRRRIPRGLVAVVISTSGARRQDQPTLAAEADAPRRRLAGQWPLPVWSRVIAERRHHACTPGAARAPGRIAPGPFSRWRLHRAELPARSKRRADRGRGGARVSGGIQRDNRQEVALTRAVHAPRGERALPVRLRISRCCSRAHSRSLIVARLSYCFLPFARPTSSLTRPLL